MSDTNTRGNRIDYDRDYLINYIRSLKSENTKLTIRSNYLAKREDSLVGQNIVSHLKINELKYKLDLLGALLLDLREGDPEIQNLKKWEAAVKSGALDGWV